MTASGTNRSPVSPSSAVQPPALHGPEKLAEAAAEPIGLDR